MISMLFWLRSTPNGWLPQPDGIRHRNSEREHLAKGCSGPKARWQDFASAARERLFWSIFNEPRRKPRSQA